MSDYPTATIKAVIATWLERRLDTSQQEWLKGQLRALQQANSDRDLYITLGLIPRKLGKRDLEPTAAEMAEADQARPGWDPSAWSIETAARLLVLCSMAAGDEQVFSEKFNELCRTADLAESITLYSGIPLYPRSDILDYQIGQGLRTHIRAVFEAIAHRSPYPREFFDQNRWNHMVLKALFVDSTLAPIQGLDERSNPELARILCDYAHERWAANRPVTHELWRCVGPHATGNMISDLQRASESSNRLEHRAAILALSQCGDSAAAELVNNYPEVRQAIDSGALTWESLAQESLEATDPR